MENTENTLSDKEVVVIGEENNAEKLPSISQAEKDEKFRQAFLALAKLNRLKKTKHRGRNPGAFGGAHPGIKKKKKLARYLAKNTIT
jgi:hypothetical protein